MKQPSDEWAVCDDSHRPREISVPLRSAGGHWTVLYETRATGSAEIIIGDSPDKVNGLTWLMEF